MSEIPGYVSRFLMLPPFFLLVLVFLPACSDSDRFKPNIILITADTMRADHIGCYGYSRGRTPHIDRLAGEGVLFADHTVSVPLTLPSHATILTGVYPSRHKVHDNATYVLSDGFTTLSEYLRDFGYRTAAFVSSFQLDRKYGLSQGFDEYDDRIPEEFPVFDRRIAAGPMERKIRLRSGQRRAGDVTDFARAWLRKSKSEPFFLWLHYFDPHDMYDPPPPYDRLFPDRAYPDSLYDGEITYVDNGIGELVGLLEQHGIFGRTLLLFCADHGEGLGEHGESHHDLFVYDSTLRSPLIIGGGASDPSWPGLITRTVTSADILPTLLDLLDIPLSGPVDGRTLMPLLSVSEGSGEERSIYMESYSAAEHYLCAPLLGIRKGGWKYIDAPAPELYRVDLDPGETENVVDLYPAVTEELRGELDAFLGGDAAPAMKLDTETRERLEAIGYIQEPETLIDPGTEREADPKEYASYVDSVHLATRHLTYGEYDAALDVYLGLKDRFPGRDRINNNIGNILLRLERYTEAIDIFTQLTAEFPGYAKGHYYLGVAFGQTGLETEAMESLREAVRQDGNLQIAHYYLGLALAATGERTAAHRSWERTVAIDPNTAEAGAARRAMRELIRDGGW